MRHRVFQLVVVARQHRSLRGNRTPSEPAVARELEPDQLRLEPVDGGAAEDAALRVEQVAVRGLAAQQRGDLVDEALEDSVQLELARQHLPRAQEGRLLLEATLVLLEQPRRMDRERELARHCLQQRDLVGRPLPRRRPVDAENADHTVEGGLGGADSRTLELRGVIDVGNDDGPVSARREIRSRQVLRLRADRLQAGRKPLGLHAERLVAVPEANEAAGGAERPPDLGHGDARPLADVGDRAHATGDLADEALARQRLVEGPFGARPRERERGLGGERLHQGHLAR